VNDMLVGPVLACGILGSGIICFGVGAVVGLSLTDTWAAASTDFTWLFFAILGAIIGAVLFAQGSCVIRSGVDTILVCFAMDQASLQRNDPNLFALFETSYNGAAARQIREGYRQ